MTKALVFDYFAVVTAHSKRSRGGYRETDIAPSKSAIVGLLACCMGLPRDDKETYRKLTQLGMTTVTLRFLVDGEVIFPCKRQDFHTSMSFDFAADRTLKKLPPLRQRSAQLFAARQAKRGNPDYSRYFVKGATRTTLSQREMLFDTAYVVILTHEDEELLETLQGALRAPTWTPYAGRKAFPFAAPFQARFIEGETENERVEKALEGALPMFETVPSEVRWEGAKNAYQSSRPVKLHQRYDRPRQNLEYGVRDEFSVALI
jgi:CRISPR system Cascade subunit CasD